MTMKKRYTKPTMIILEVDKLANIGVSSTGTTENAYGKRGYYDYNDNEW